MNKFFTIAALLFAGTALSAMVRAGVDVGPGPVYYGDGYYSDGYYYYNDWYGPGIYYGVYYGDYPSYYAWRRNYGYYGGPYYWRRNYHHGNYHGHHHGHKHGGKHHK